MSEELSNGARTLTLVLTAAFAVLGILAGVWLYYATA